MNQPKKINYIQTTRKNKDKLEERSGFSHTGQNIIITLITLQRFIINIDLKNIRLSRP